MKNVYYCNRPMSGQSKQGKLFTSIIHCNGDGTTCLPADCIWETLINKYNNVFRDIFLANGNVAVYKMKRFFAIFSKTEARISTVFTGSLNDDNISLS